jgi:hypothetical protein
MRKQFGAMIGCLAGLVVLASNAQAAIAWPANNQWIPLTVGGGIYTDAVGDYNPDYTDIVGGVDSIGNPHTAGFYYTDGVNMMFRMRVDNPIAAVPQSVWSILIDTNQTAEIDWVLQLDQKNDGQVEFVQAVAGTTDYLNPAKYLEDVTPHNDAWAIADYVRKDQNATAITGSQFHQNGGDDDYFVDIAMPISTFFSISGATYTTPIRIALGTSQDDQSLNKDRPDAAGYLSDPILIPEPDALILIGVGGALGFLRRRRC